jgi:hypothetical protein
MSTDDLFCDDVLIDKVPLVLKWSLEVRKSFCEY